MLTNNSNSIETDIRQSVHQDSPQPSEESRRCVLLVTTDYPPLAGTNTRRIEAFAKYLPTYGWQPVVLTLAIEDMALIESSWQGDGEIETIRVEKPRAPGNDAPGPRKKTQQNKTV